MIIALWEGGADPNALYENGDTLLHRLCLADSLDFLEILKRQMTNSSVAPQFETKIVGLFKQYGMLDAKNSSGDTPIFSALNFTKKNFHTCGNSIMGESESEILNDNSESEWESESDADNSSADTPFFSSLNNIKKTSQISGRQVGDGTESEETKILGIVRFLGENGADVNVVNNYGYSPLLLAVLRNFDKVKDYLVAKGAVLFSKPSKRLTRSANTKQASNVHDAKSDEKNERRIAEVVTDLFFGEVFGGESCEYLKALNWLEDPMYRMKGIHSFEVLLKKVEIWLKKNENICDIELVKQVAMNNLKQSKLIEEDHCVICYSNKPSVTLFPCGHRIFCDDCHELGSGEYEKKGCACCRRKICMFFKLDDTEPKKTGEVAEKLTKMT